MEHIVLTMLKMKYFTLHSSICDDGNGKRAGSSGRQSPLLIASLSHSSSVSQLDIFFQNIYKRKINPSIDLIPHISKDGSDICLESIVVKVTIK